MKFTSYLAFHAANNPTKEALICGNHRATFAQLDTFSTNIAVGLQKLGLKTGDRVGLYMHNCIEFAFAFFGIIKAGGIAVPLNMRLATPEIAFILEDAKPFAVFIASNEATSFGEAAVDTTNLLRIAVGGAPAANEFNYAELLTSYGDLAEVPVEFDDCMISYTSGTTGQPKGAVLTQANYIVMNGFLNGLYWGFNKEDRILITTPLAHRTAFARFGNLIVHGCTLVIMPRFDAGEVARTIDVEKITVLGVVPTVVRLLISEIEARPSRFASVERVLATGEAFAVDLKKQFLELLPNVKLYSFLSMTEVGVITLLYPEEQIAQASTVGRVVPGVEIKLVDDNGLRVPFGQAGEVWVRTGQPGRFLTMREYYQRPEANAESFRNGWFATGDMAIVDGSGYVTVVDRKKDMILSGGYNIYSKEVEAALGSHPAVAQAAVIGVPDPVFGEAVAAYLMLKPGTITSADELTVWCGDRIASYKKPKHYRFVSKLPENGTGKVLKRVLREDFFRP